MAMILVITLSSFVLSEVANKNVDEIRLVCVSVTCGVLWLLSGKLRKYLEYILMLFSLLFCIGAFFLIKESIVPTLCYPAFFLGYILGTYEKLITLKLPRIRFKLLFSTLLMIAKILILPATKAVEIFSFVLQIVMIIFSLIADFLKEKEDRKTFQSFYDYRESLTKFKNLLVSGLSTNLLIISGDLKEEFFSNECLRKTISEKAQPDQTYIQTLHEWLRSLKVDKRSLTESVTNCLLLNETGPSVLKLLKACSWHHWFNGQDKNISFSAEYLDEKAQCLKIYEISITSIVWDTKDSIAIILNDITAHSQNQTLKLADSNKDKMLAMVSHELRTPINGILGVVKILQNQIKDPQVLQYLSICKSSGELLYNLVNSILDLQHLRDNKFSLKVVRYDLYELMRGVHDLFKFQFEEKNLYLNLEVAPTVPQFIVTDQNRLRQILINLIGNALKFTFKGGVTISVDIDPENKEFMIRFSVADTGIGIKEEDRAKLFKMYGRLDQENSLTNTQGVGFGLEISNRLCKLLADQANQSGIQCESEFGKGTKFSFSIKDYNHSCNGGDEAQFFEPQIFAEAIENLSIKLSPYSLSTTRSDKDATPSRFPLLINRNSSQHLLPALPTLTPKRNPLFPAKTSLTQIYYLNQTPTKSKFQPISSSHSVTRTELLLNSPGISQRENDSPGQADQFRFDSSESREDRLKSPSEEKQSILIIDDNSFNLLVAKHLLESLGYLVETALNGQLGVEMVKSFIGAKKNKFAAILMDLQMPVMDGYEATRVLKEMMGKNEIPDMPIIALSANDTEEDKLKSKKVGMYDHLSKPLKEEELRRLLAEVFDESDPAFGSFGEVN